MGVDKNSFSYQLVNQVGVFLATTLSFVVAFAWNDAIRSYTVEHRDDKGRKVISPWVFALGMTGFALMLMTIWAVFYSKSR